MTYQFVLYAHTWALKHWRLSQFTDIEGYIAQGFDFFVHAMATPRGLETYAEFRQGREEGAQAPAATDAVDLSAEGAVAR